MFLQFNRMIRTMRNGPQSLVLVATLLMPVDLTAQFNFTNGPSGATIVPSMANQTCAPAGGGMNGGGMGMGGGACDNSPFLQEVITLGGADYYHVVVGDTAAAFGLEFYLRTAPGAVCWFGCANARVGGGGMNGMPGMGGGGISPLSASSGSATNDSAPLSSTNSGTGRPDAVAIRQVNRTAEITQEFLKTRETNKPRISQSLVSANVTLNFAIDMSATNYTTSAAGVLTLTQAVNEPIPPRGTNPATRSPLPSATNFNIANAGPGSSVNITGGRYTYSPGSGDGGSLGVYSYFADSFNVYAINWASYCDATQNPVSLCTRYGGVRAGMGMGGGAPGGAMGGGGGMPGGAGATMGGAPLGGTAESRGGIGTAAAILTTGTRAGTADLLATKDIW